MFRCLAYLGVVVAGLSIVACWGCGGKSTQEASPTKKAEQGAKGTKAAQPSATDSKTPGKTPEKPVGSATKTPEGTEKPVGSATKTPEGTEKPAAGTTEAPQGAETPAPAEAGETSGRGGRAVGKVFKHLIETPKGGKPAQPAPF